MLENFSPQAISLIEKAEEIAKNNNKILVGTEDLLLAMYNVEDTICHFLLGILHYWLKMLKKLYKNILLI